MRPSGPTPARFCSCRGRRRFPSSSPRHRLAARRDHCRDRRTRDAGKSSSSDWADQAPTSSTWSPSPVEQIHTYDRAISTSTTLSARQELLWRRARCQPEKSRLFRGHLFEDASRHRLACRARRRLEHHQLRDANFVFVCIDDGLAKAFIIEKLEEFGRSFIDVGMGIFLRHEALAASCASRRAPGETRPLRGKQRIPLSGAAIERISPQHPDA